MTVLVLRHNYNPTTPVFTWWESYHRHLNQPVGKVIAGHKLGLIHASSEMKIWAFAGNQTFWADFAAWVNTQTHEAVVKAPTVHLYTDTTTHIIRKQPFTLVLEPLVMDKMQALKYARHYWQADLEHLFPDLVDIDRTEMTSHLLSV